MAKNKNHQELRRQALLALDQGRAEISAEVRHLRMQLSPKRVMRRAVDRHASLVVGLALTAGITSALFLFRGKRPPGRVAQPVRVTVSKSPPQSMVGAALFGLLGVLAKAMGPTVIKSAVLPRLLESFSKTTPLDSTPYRSAGIPDGVGEIINRPATLKSL